MHAHNALRPPHMLNVQPHMYATVSSERLSNARGMDDPSSANDDNFNIDPAFHQYVVTGEMLDPPSPEQQQGQPQQQQQQQAPPPPLTAEQAMEVDAARALEELAVAGRMEAWHGGHDTPPPNNSSGEEFNPNQQQQLPPPPNFHPQFPSPLSAPGSLDHNNNNASMPANHDSERGSSAEGEGTGGMGVGGPSSYYRDPMSRTAALSAQRSRKRSAGVPVPVPHLTKPSRGRRVPTAAAESDGDGAGDGNWSPPGSRSGTSSPYGTRSRKLPTPGPMPVLQVGAMMPEPPKPTTPTAADVAAKIQSNVRSYICQVEGCGKAFRRGEHLKRHVRSLHTHEKRESILSVY